MDGTRRRESALTCDEISAPAIPTRDWPVLNVFPRILAYHYAVQVVASTACYRLERPESDHYSPETP
jgi:hypothetical protein